MKSNSLADRMKRYETPYSGQRLLPRLPVCARMDGRAFHSFTAGLPRPFDERLSRLMIATTVYLVEQTTADVGYTQSDEISLVWVPRHPDAETFFEGRVAKMTSVLAAMTTAFFNSRLADTIPERAGTLPVFDGRVWNVPSPAEAAAYLVWRELDATRNSLSMAAQAYYPAGELHGRRRAEVHDLLFAKGVNWNDYPIFFKRGTHVQKRTRTCSVSAADLERLPARHPARTDPAFTFARSEVVPRELPPLARVANKAAVLFEGAVPEAREVVGRV
jgi:tRNA(His) guanylyltransferase